MSLEDWNYYNDPRVIASLRSRAWTIDEMSRGLVRLTLREDIASSLIEDGCYQEDWTGEMTLAVTAVVCDTCSGHGKVVDPSIDAGGIGAGDDFWVDDYDDGTGESRYHRGDYDIPCPACRGLRVVFEPEFPATVDAVIRAWRRDEDAHLRESLAERRMGC